MLDDARIEVANLADVPEGTAKAICMSGRQILLCNSGGTIYAIGNECSHAFQRLECGLVRDGWIACPAHGARFDLATGRALGPPATEPIETFPVEIEAGRIYLRAPAST